MSRFDINVINRERKKPKYILQKSWEHRGEWYESCKMFDTLEEAIEAKANLKRTNKGEIFEAKRIKYKFKAEVIEDE